MAYNHDSITAGDLLSQIKLRLGAVWTEHDSTDGVYKTTTDDGQDIFLQLTENAGEYIQLQGWHDWDETTHTGTNGSGTSYQRVYYATSPVATGTAVELYMSVTTNRMWMVVDCPSGGLRGWGYFGGLVTEVDDLTAVVIGTNYMRNRKMIMFHTSLQSAAWDNTSVGVICPVVAGGNDGILGANDGVYEHNPEVWDDNRFLSWQVFCLDSTTASGWLTGANAQCRGLLDGVLLISRTGTANLDELTIDTSTFLVTVPIDKNTAYSFMSTSAAYCYAFEEV